MPTDLRLAPAFPASEATSAPADAPVQDGEFAGYRGRLYRIREVLEDRNVPATGRATIHRWIKDGRLAARKVAGSTMIIGDSLADLLEGRTS